MIDSGSQGVVFLCRHKLSQMQYAMKIVQKQKNNQMLQGTNENFHELALMKYSTEKQLKNVLPAIEI